MSTRSGAGFLVRQLVAVLAILVIAGSWVSGVVAASARPTAAVITDFPLYAEFSPNDPVYRTGAQWGLPQIGAPQAWDVTLGSSSVIIAIVDTGVVWTHTDLRPNMWTNPLDGTHGYDFVNGDTNPTEMDPSGVYHGTGVSGVAGAVTDNGQWIAGTAQVSVMALRALGSNGQGSSFNTSQAIRWAADHGARIINLSLGTNETFGGPTDIQLAINYAWSRGALIVAAAGNSGSGTLDYPARLSNVVSVAAINRAGSRAYFSNYGTGLDLSAPGTEIWTLNGNNDVHEMQGTSFAAPFVSASAALLLSVDDTLTNVEVWDILNRTAVQPSGSGYNTNYGWGVVNAWNAIDSLSQPFVSLISYPSTVSRSSTFGVSWSVRGPAGLTVTDTHIEWGTASGLLGNTTAAQSGITRETFTTNGLSVPGNAGALYFKVVATVNGTQYESPEKGVTVSALPDFLFVLYELLASNLLYLALFILALAAVVAFIPQRRAARARRAAFPPRTMYPPGYYAQAARPTQPPPAPPPAAPAVQPRVTPPSPPPVEFVRPASPPTAPAPMAPAAPPAFTAATKKRCPNCGTMVNADNMFCFFCGHPFR